MGGINTQWFDIDIPTKKYVNIPKLIEKETGYKVLDHWGWGEPEELDTIPVHVYFNMKKHKFYCFVSRKITLAIDMSQAVIINDGSREVVTNINQCTMYDVKGFPEHCIETDSITKLFKYIKKWATSIPDECNKAAKKGIKKYMKKY